MSGSVEGAGFWLPSEFFDDIVTEKENIGKSHSADEFCFPTEFPYDFETETAGDFKEKRRVLSTSPQSTLSHLWSFSGGGSSPNAVASPPTTPLGAENEAVGELIYRAAGQVAKLKLGPPRRLELLYPAAAAANKPSPYLQEKMMKQQKQGSGMWCGELQMYRGWSAQQNPTRLGRSVSFGGSGPAVKRECAGTGVFLPRRYGHISNDSANAFSSDSRKRPGHSTAPYIPERNVHVPTQPQFNPGFFSDYDLLVARRNALIVQQRRSLLLEKSSPISRGGMYLPREWTY